MAAPDIMEMPSYIVYRDTSAVQGPDSAAPLAFLPPLGSDELFDALRAKFPYLKSHSERVGQASMEFFLDEQLTQQAPLAPMSQATTSTSVSPWEAALPSFSSEASTWSSPDAFGPMTPASCSPVIPLSRQQSTATSLSVSTDANPPALEAMTSVFSLANAVQPKQRVRRKMTESEKIEYRKRRMAKACDKCSKRKRKCDHNQDEMNVAASNAAAVAKRKAVHTHKSLPASSLPKVEEWDNGLTDGLTGIDSSIGSNTIPEFGDFDDAILPDVLPDSDFDDFLASSQPQWPWSDTVDWTLLDPNPRGNYATAGSGLEQEDIDQQLPLFAELDPISNSDMIRSSSMGDPSRWDWIGNAPQHHQSRSPQQNIAGAIDPTMILLKDLNESADQRDAQSWAAQRSQEGMPHPISRHVPQNERSVDQPMQSRKRAAVNTAADGRDNQRSPSLADSMSSASGEVEQRSTTKPVDTRRRRTAAAKSPQESILAQAKIPTTEPRQHSMITSRQGDAERQRTNDQLGKRTARAKLDGGRDRNDRVPQEDLVKRDTVPANAGLGLNKAPGSSRGMLQQQHAQEDKRAVRFGEGLTSSISPSTQLFMLKRKLPQTLRNTAAGAEDSTCSSIWVPRLQATPRELQTGSQDGEVFSAGDHVAGLALQIRGTEQRGISLSSSPTRSRTVGIAGLRPHPAYDRRCERTTRFATCEVPEERLSDHVRRRDHFGRVQQVGLGAAGAVGKVVAQVGLLLVLLAFLPFHAFTGLSAVLTAVAVPLSAGLGASSTLRSGVGRAVGVVTKSLSPRLEAGMIGADVSRERVKGLRLLRAVCA